MTTYTLTGLSITYNQNDDPIAVGTATLQVVVPNDQAFFNYSLIQVSGDDLPEVDLGGTEPQGVRINGANFPDSPFNEDFLGTLTTSQGTHILLDFYQASTRTDFIFQIGGPPLTLPTTLAGLQALENSITGFGVATGPFAPGQDIPLSSLLGVQVSNAGAPVSIINGDAGNNQLEGTLANDDITTGGGSDYVIGSIGNDTIRTGDNGGTDGYVDLDYSSLDRGIAVVINGQNGTGSVNKADAGSDTLLGVSAPMNAGSLDGGFGLFGTGSNDTFDLNVGASQWMQVRGGLGVDSYVISGAGQVRLRFDGGIDDVSVNLATGQVLNDGFGNVETISGQVWELQSGDGNDRLIGSAANESFLAGGGTDTVDGGGGFDRIRYDRFGYENGVTVDLGAGTASGTWFGDAFNHTLTSIEWVRGSSGNDTIIGSSADERFEGRGGIDSFVYNGGNDTISDFDFTSETLTVGLALTRTQVDAALTAASTTGQGVRVDFGGGNTLTFENASVANVQGLAGTAGGSEPGMVIPGTGGADVLNGGTGDDTINAGFGNDTVFGGGGNDQINAGFGFDLVYGGDGNDVVLGLNGFDTIYGDGGNDTLSGNAGNDVLYGGDGDDLLNGGIGFDELHGDAGDDSLIGLRGGRRPAGRRDRVRHAGWWRGQ